MSGTDVQVSTALLLRLRLWLWLLELAERRSIAPVCSTVLLRLLSLPPLLFLLQLPPAPAVAALP